LSAIAPHAVAAALYAAAFPLAGLIDGAVLTLALVATLPFLVIGYVMGAAFVFVFDNAHACSVGLFLATFIQIFWLETVPLPLTLEFSG
jgi:ABC-type uncharacterized transport system permease subunit